MIRAALRFLVDALKPRSPATPPAPPSPEAIAMGLVTEIYPEVSVAVWNGTPLKEIADRVAKTHSPQWQREHGLAAAYRAERLVVELGPVVFLSVDEARRAGLPLPKARGR